MLSDFKFALRQLAKSPGFASTVIVTLALSIGACTAMFSIVNTVLLNPPNGVPDPERVVQIRESRVPDRPESPATVANFLDWKRVAASFQDITASTSGRATVIGGAEPLPLTWDKWSEGTPAVLKYPVVLGRWFQADEFSPGKDKVVVLRYEFWQRAFGGDPGVISRKIILTAATATTVVSEEAFTVIGVSAPRSSGPPRDLILPLVFSDELRANRDRRNVFVFGRLKPGATLSDAQSEMDVIAGRLAQQYPEANKGWGIKLTSLAEVRKNEIGNTLWMMMAAVVSVLLIACANVANLQLVRATARHREMSIRAALGAGRLRLTRQLLTESLTLALLGGGAGVLLANWALAGYQAFAPGFMRRGFTYEADGSMLAFALILSVGTGLLSGILPAWFASRVNLNHALNSATRGSTAGGRGAWVRSAMVVVQVACTVMLLAGAALFLRSFNNLVHTDPGFAPSHAIGLRLFNLSAKRYPNSEKRNAFVDEVLTRVRALHGVQAAGAALQLPINDSQPAQFSFAVNEVQIAQPKSTWPAAAYYTASPDYFRAAGFRLLRGRSFAAEDHAKAQRVAIVNDTLARRYFADRDPVGQEIRIATGYDGPRVIVGVVSDIKQSGLDQESICQVYEPNTQGFATGTNFVVRHTGDAATLIPLLKQQVYAVDKTQPITGIMPLEEMVNANIETPRFRTQLVAVFSLVALLIAAVGIYGVMAYSVSQRTTEIGIRMALGATSHDVLRQVLTGGFGIIGIGLAVGLAGTVALSRLLTAMLYHTSPRDPVALTAIVCVIGLAALLACWLPARRATKVDPLVALRAE
jgi:putative ABC transport system permease protein